ncbi:hypothetical protein D9601_10240 [Sphingomonas sp. MA1305]|uniref:hypothetical protein n=1 Tax=Sphingomonas sp. MA1305 TaxID=2479204 RepID=UPI0018DF6E3C|nr:hypothetical protein [Sphingomonas sp. MA1305]MBI0475730.1 hypothetical protein [Sphingomonas sp. MA1305]
MLFGLQSAFQPEAAKLADAHARLQTRMENDPDVPTMQPGGVTQLPPPAFVYGEGGRRLTPDMIAQRSRMAQGMIAQGMDTSPVGSWTQGLARVAQSLVGAMQQRRLDKASEANAADSNAVAKALASGSGNDPAGYDSTLLGAALNPYIDPNVRSYAMGERERLAKANAPDYFMSGDDRVRYDPRTGQSTVIYDAPQDSEAYASSLGLQPGTPEYSTAVQDYVLRGNGPTAHQFDSDLEDDRQGNRMALEDTRQQHRLSLRGTPTYSDLHPRPRAASTGGGRSSSRPPTMAGTMAPILGKVARGETLTPAEQNAWNMYRPPNRGRGGRSVASALVSGGAGASGSAPVQVKSKEDYARLPAGASFIDPNGVQRVKGR